MFHATDYCYFSLMQRLIFCYIVIFFGFVRAQELPPLKSFYPQTYKGGDQNWDLTQDDNKIIYVANNKGLLTFNGSQWELFPTPNESIIRTVLAVGNRIYSGHYNDFGYWERDELGNMTYSSLMKRFNLTPLEDEEFWGIETMGDWMVFQSLDRIYVINEATKRVNIIESESTLTELVVVEDNIVFQKIGQGIYRIVNGKQLLMTDDPLLVNEILVDVFKKGSLWYFTTQEGGIFEYDGVMVKKSNQVLESELALKSIYSACHLRDNSYAVGTISDGLLLFNEKGELIYEFNQSNGLSNNTVLSVFEDIDGNIWLAMDNGISLINKGSNIKVYYDQEGALGTVYTSALYNGQLFLGTNQGLFVKSRSNEFKLLSGTEGQVWNLAEVSGQLFCGHDKGTFVINRDNEATLISNIKGTWSIKQIPGYDDLLIQGTYNGLYILQQNNGDWGLRNKVEGFDTSARYFEFLDKNRLVVSHEYKGLYYLDIDKNYHKIHKITEGRFKEAVNSSLVNFRNGIYYASQDGIFKYFDDENRFMLDSTVNQLTEYSKYVSGKLVKTNNDMLWYASDQGISYLRPDNLTGDLKITHLALPLSMRSTKSGYENVMHLKGQKYVLGTTEGYIVLDISKNKSQIPQVMISAIESSQPDGNSTAVNFKTSKSFKIADNSFKFYFYAPSYDTFLAPEFRYKLLGYYDQWSSWTSSSSIQYENLPFGEYQFEVQSKVGNLVSEDIASYKFRIEKPWYVSHLALLAYCILLVFIGFGIHKVYQGYYRRQRQRLLNAKEKELAIKELENQKQLIQFKNENLQLDIENKSRELGLSTMNLIQKNEVLNDIKNQLNKVGSLKEVKEVVRLINRQLNTTADWKVFEEAFNNADKEFLKSVKAKHPNLTSNDLRLCAYLRLNLSSKEIAPLLNISHKSVEVKRYRLRKKMDLNHDVNLTDYILQI